MKSSARQSVHDRLT